MEPVTLKQVKTQLRIDEDDVSYDEQLGDLIKGAREWCEGYQNRAYITQTFELALDCWPQSSSIRLPRPPLQNVATVDYTDATSTVVTWPSSGYIVDTYSEPADLVAVSSWPSSRLPVTNGIVVTYTAGYGDDGSKVPMKIKQAIMLLVTHWFENGMCDPPPAVLSLLGLDRVVPV